MECIVQDRPVGYDKTGKSDKVVVMLHGWGTDRTSLNNLVKALSTNYSVIAVDVPGFGESQKPEGAWGLTEYAAWLGEFLKKVGVTSPYALLGHSNGGAIAIKTVAGGLPVNKLILLGASGVRSRERGRKLIYKVVAKTGKTATVVLPKKVRHKLRTSWYKRIGSEYHDVRGMEDTFAKVTSEDLVIDAAMISVPTLLVYGGADEATPPSYGRIYHEVIEGSELDIIEGAGHYAFRDKADFVIDRIRKFLK